MVDAMKIACGAGYRARLSGELPSALYRRSFANSRLIDRLGTSTGTGWMSKGILCSPSTFTRLDSSESPEAPKVRIMRWISGWISIVPSACGVPTELKLPTVTILLYRSKV